MLSYSHSMQLTRTPRYLELGYQSLLHVRETFARFRVSRDSSISCFTRRTVVGSGRYIPVEHAFKKVFDRAFVNRLNGDGFCLNFVIFRLLKVIFEVYFDRAYILRVLRNTTCLNPTRLNNSNCRYLKLKHII